MSDTPNCSECEAEIKDLTIRAQVAERERDAYKRLALEMAKELAIKCDCAVHKQQIEQLQEDTPYWAKQGSSVCTSDFSNCQLPTDERTT